MAEKRSRGSGRIGRRARNENERHEHRSNLLVSPMKAAVSTRYGSPDILEIREVPKPEPKANEVLVRVHATTVSRTDRGMLRADPFIVRFFFGLCRPKRTILGVDFAGEVEAVGAGVTSFKPGQRVFGISHWLYGAHAEYLCVPENSGDRGHAGARAFRRGGGRRGRRLRGHVYEESSISNPATRF